MAGSVSAQIQVQPPADTSSSTDLDEVVISASRWPEPARDVPQQVVRLKSAQIELRNPQTAADALAQTGQVYIQKSQQGGGSPMLRGFTANGILLVMDGIRMNNAIFRGGNLQSSILADPNLLSGIEVLYGAGSVLYGSDALGGVVNFSTVQTQYSDSLRIGGTALVRYATANEERAVHASIRLSAPRWTGFVGLTVTEFRDLRMGRWRSPYDSSFGLRRTVVVTENGQDRIEPNANPHIQLGSGYTQYNGLLKLGYKISPRADLHYTTYATTSSNIARYDRLNPPNGANTFAEWYYGPQFWMLHSLQLNLHQGVIYDDARITIAYQDYNESRHDRRFGNANRRDQYERVDVYTLNADFRRKLASRHELYYGLEAWYNDVKSDARRVNIRTGGNTAAATRYPDGGSEVASGAVYTQYVGKFLPGVTLVAGGRGTWYRLESRFADKAFFPFPYDVATLETGSVNGMLGLVAEPLTGVRLAGNLSTGFRAPNVDDVGKVFDSRPGNAATGEVGLLVVPNPDLNPERTTTIDASAEYRTSDFRIGGTVYYTWLSDALEQRPFTLNGQGIVDFGQGPSQVQAVQNVSTAYIWGISGEAEAFLNTHLRLHTTLSYNHGRDEFGIPLKAVPPLFGRSSLHGRFKRFQAEANVLYQGWMRVRDLDPNDNAESIQAGLGTPSWWTLNLYTRTQLPWGLELGLSVENIADRHYRTYESGISAAGRNVIASLRKTF